MTRLIAVLVLLATAIPALAQDGFGPRIEALEEFRDELRPWIDAQVPLDEPVQVMPVDDDFGRFLLVEEQRSFPQQVDEPPAPVIPDSTTSQETLAAYDASLRRYYENRAAQLDHRTAVFAWQHLSSQIIFFVVIGVVGIGLYFSWMQFHATKPGAAPLVTEMELSQSGLKVSSPVLGVIILVLSLAFFYLYLTHVYPISEIGGP